jgi:hypothetical protein
VKSATLKRNEAGKERQEKGNQELENEGKRIKVGKER